MFIIILLDFHSGKKIILVLVARRRKMKEFIMFWQPWKTHCVNHDIIRNNQRKIWSNKRNN
jgi:hypothetical protein